MILKRYSVCENRFCEYTIDDNELQFFLEDLCFEDKDAALEKCKELNLEQQKNSIYKQNEIIAQDLEVAEKIQIFIKLTLSKHLCSTIEENIALDVGNESKKITFKQTFGNRIQKLFIKNLINA